MAWALRIGYFDEQSYVDPDKFTIRMYHNGDMLPLSYVNGHIAHFDYCDKDNMSMCEIIAMAKELGHHGIINYWYKLPGTGIGAAMTLLKRDDDVLDMVAFVPDVRIIEVYLEHILDSAPCDVANLGWDLNDFGIDLSKSSNVGVRNRKNIVTEELGLDHLDEDDNACDLMHAELANEKDDNDNENLEGDYHPEADFVDSDYSGDDDYEEVGYSDGITSGIDVQASGKDGGSAHVNACANDGETTCGSDANITNNFSHSMEPESWDMVMNNFQLEDVEEEEDHFSNEELRSIHDSDDENNSGEKREPEFNPETDMKDPQFELGMLFSDCHVFRAAIREYAMLHGYEMRWKRNEEFKLKVLCKGEFCPWLIYAGKRASNDYTLQVKKYVGEHSCSRVYNNRTCTADWLAKKFKKRLQSDPNMPVNAIVDAASDEWTVGISNMKVYRAKRQAIDEIEGALKKQYDRLWDYCEELKRTNPGTTTKMQCDFVDGYPKFKRLYICLEACKKGFKEGCRCLVGLDGCHLKGVYGGQLLTACSIDANNETWVIAYAVVELESRDSWTWFLELLVHDLNIVNQYGWTFILDKQKGLPGAFNDVLPNTEHRFCTRHLYTNFRSKFRGKVLKDKLWAAAKSTTQPWFKKHMDELKVLSKAAFDWLVKFPAEYWSKSHFRTYVKCDMLMNNMCESLNKTILPARDKPIITMLELIRCLLMRRIHTRRDKMKKWPHKVCPKVFKKIEHRKVLAGALTVEWSGGPKYLVKGPGEQFVVNLEQSMCHLII